jgi:hypothetical protein
MQTFGQMIWLPVSLFARWMDLLAMAMPQPCFQGQAPNGSVNAPGMGFPGSGTYGDNPWAQRHGAIKEGKEERNMSDRCCCDNDHGMVKLVEYTIVSIKRCDERILYKSEIIETEDMSEEAFATWVVALYLQEPGIHVPHEDKKYLRVYHHVLQEWPRQKEDCCEDRQVHVLRGIEKAIRNLTRHVGGELEEAPAPS